MHLTCCSSKVNASTIIDVLNSNKKNPSLTLQDRDGRNLIEEVKPSTKFVVGDEVYNIERFETVSETDVSAEAENRDLATVTEFISNIS